MKSRSQYKFVHAKTVTMSSESSAEIDLVSISCARGMPASPLDPDTAEEDPSPRRSARRRRRRRGHGPEELGVWWTSRLGAGPFARVPYRSACRFTRWLICISARAKGPAPSGTSTTRLAPWARAHAFFSSGARSVVGSGPPPPCLGRAGRRASRVRVTPPAAAPSRPLHLRECSAPSCISAPSRMLIVPPLAAVLSLGARQDAMRVMQGPWTPRCYCTVADLLRFIASHFITRVASRCVNTNRSRRFIMSPVPPCGKQSPVVLELASFQWLVNLLEAASTLGTAATLHWLGDGRVGGSVGWVGGRDPPIHPPPNRLSGYP